MNSYHFYCPFQTPPLFFRPQNAYVEARRAIRTLARNSLIRVLIAHAVVLELLVMFVLTLKGFPTLQLHHLPLQIVDVSQLLSLTTTARIFQDHVILTSSIDADIHSLLVRLLL